MVSQTNAPRLLGIAFLFVVFTSLVGGLLSPAAGSGSISDVLVSIANNPVPIRFSILLQMVTCVGIVALAGLLYVVLSKQNRIIALVALGLWLAEVIALAVSQLGVLALIPLSLDFVGAGAPDHSYYQALGTFLYYGIDKAGITMHMWFYSVGGMLWYSLFVQSRYVPRAIPVYGVAAAALATVGVVLELLGNSVPIYFYLPLFPFELAIGAWLSLKGIRGAKDDSEAPQPARLVTSA